jgi:cysteine-rich repeat protein
VRFWVPSGFPRRLAAAFALAAAACGETGSAPSAQPAASCGNGVVEAGEACDDGNASNGDGCLATCRTPVAWTTGDVHAHSMGCAQQVSPEELAARLQAQQIQVAAALVWGFGYEVDARFFTGRDHPVSRPGFILHYDAEVSRFAAARTGHLLLLGLDSLAWSSQPFDIPQSGVPIVEWARRQPRSLIGMAHFQFWPADGSQPLPPGGCCVPWEAVVHAARGRLDFISTEQPLDEETAPLLVWRALQNTGFRVALVGGSDWSCISQRFDEWTLRSDAIVDGPLTYESWLQALRAGRVTTARGIGNHLDVRVEGRRMGEELTLSAPRDVSVTLETAGQASEIELLVNGEAVRRVSVPAGVQLVELPVAVTRSSWVAARSRYVLANPVYVIVAGQPIRASTRDACYLLRNVEHMLDLGRSRRLNLFASEPEALRAYEEARVELLKRVTETGSGCG